MTYKEKRDVEAVQVISSSNSGVLYANIIINKNLNWTYLTQILLPLKE